MAGGVAAVLGQQHADVHFVGFGFQVGKKAADAKPMLAPFAVPVGGAVDDPLLVFFGQLVPGRVTRNARRFGMAHQIGLGLCPGRCLHRLDGTGAQREFVIGDHQAQVHTNHPPKPPANSTRSNRRVERKHRSDRIAVTKVALWAMQTRGEFVNPELAIGFFRPRLPERGLIQIGRHPPVAVFQGHFNSFHQAAALHRVQPEPVGHHVKQFARPGGAFNIPFGLDFGETAGRQPLPDLLQCGVGRQLHRKGHHQACPGLLCAQLQ